MLAKQPLRICYFGTYRANYSRNQVMIAGLRQNGAVVIECHETLWRGVEDRVQAASGGWRRLSFILRLLRVYLRLTWRFFQLPDFDVMVTGYPGQLDVFLARLLSRLRRKPLAWDVFMSIYLIAVERGLHEKSPSTVRWLAALERNALRLPDLLIHDTQEYVAWLQRQHGIDPARFRLVPTGADDHTYYPVTCERDPQIFRVVYFGTFIPNHGVPAIVAAAALLADDSRIHFDLIGDGPERQSAEQQAAQLGLTNLTFYGWMEPAELRQLAGCADLCLGVFGTTPQSLMTVQNKIYAGLAMRLPVVTGDSPTMRQVFQHRQHLYLVERLNPQALADAILSLRNQRELMTSIARQGHAYYLSNFTTTALGAKYLAYLNELAAKHANR